MGKFGGGAGRVLSPVETVRPIRALLTIRLVLAPRIGSRFIEVALTGSEKVTFPKAKLSTRS